MRFSPFEMLDRSVIVGVIKIPRSNLNRIRKHYQEALHTKTHYMQMQAERVTGTKQPLNSTCQSVIVMKLCRDQQRLWLCTVFGTPCNYSFPSLDMSEDFKGFLVLFMKFYRISEKICKTGKNPINTLKEEYPILTSS